MEERNLIIFTDSGDTLIDEGSEVRKEEGGVVYAAECHSGTFLKNFAEVVRIVSAAYQFCHILYLFISLCGKDFFCFLYSQIHKIA